MASPQPTRAASTAPSQRVARKAVGASSIHSASPRPVSLALRPASTWSAPPIHPQPGQQHQHPHQQSNQYPQAQAGQYGHPQQGQPVAQPNQPGGVHYPQQPQPNQYQQPHQQHQSPSQQYQQPSQQHHQPNQQQQLPSHQHTPQPQQQQQPPYQQPQHQSPHQQQTYPNQQQPQPQQQPQQQAYPQQHEHQQQQQTYQQVPPHQQTQQPPQPQQHNYQQQQVPQPQQQHDYHQQLSQQQQQQQQQPQPHHHHQPSISNPSVPQNPPPQPTLEHPPQPSPASPSLQHPQSISDHNSIHSFTAEHGRPPSISSSSAGVATPGTTITTPSTLTSPLWEHAAVPPAMQPAPSGRVSTGQTSSNSSICNHCRKAIPPNVSIYTCLICSTARITTVFCVWCFTANAVNMSHGHDKTYYVTDSDPRVQLSVPDPTSHLWTIRKNVSGRLWYTHNSTGLKTHIKPTAAALSGYSGLPAGWEERRTPDGRTFYFNRKMGSSSWTKPANSLPDGWKELRTPDQVPFYINESLGLSTWDRPGQQPRKRPGQSNKVVTRSRSGQPNSNQNAGDAILSATINAARLTGHGVEVASRQMGKLGKKKNWKKMGRIMTQASGLSMDSDGEGGGGNSSDDGGYEDQGQYQENVGFQQAAFSDQQSFTDVNQAQAGYQQPAYEQQAVYQYSAQQEQPVFEQPALYDNSGQFAYPGNEPQQGYEQQQEPQYQYGQNPAYDQQSVQEQQPVPQQPVMPQEQPQYYTQETQQQPSQQPVPQQPILPQEQPQYYTQEAQQQPVQQPAQQQVPQQQIHQPVPTQQPTSFDLVMPPDQNSDLPPSAPQEPYMPAQPSQQPAVTNQVPTTQAPMYTFQQPFFYDPTPTTQAQAPVSYQSPVYSPTYIPPEQSQLPHNNQPEIITSDAPLVETYNSDSTTLFVDNASFVTGSGQPNAVNEPVSTIPDSQGDIVVEVTIQQQPEPLDVQSQSNLVLISTPEPLIIQENDQAPDSVLAAQSTQLQGDMDASAACLALI